jgi:hypothetical protein
MSADDKRTEGVIVGGWQINGLRLEAPNGVIRPDQLLHFAREVLAQFPIEEVVIEEYGLRVCRYVADGDGARLGPHLEWKAAS